MCRASSAFAQAVSPPVDLESDEGLEMALRRELAEMIRASGISDADVLLDILIDGMAHRSSPMCLSNQATP